MRLARALTAALMATLFVAGCGGGGGGGGGNGGEPPIADAGDDAEARLYRPHTLIGEFSSDPEEKELTYAWSVISAPDGSAVTLTSGGTAANVAFTPDVEGVYLFGLVVSDGKKLSALDTVEVTVELRIAVFADRYGEVARELELAGAGRADDFVGWPDSYVAAATGDVVIIDDRRLRQQSLIAYRAADGTQEQLVTGEEIDQILAAGDHVVWSELRGGRYDLFTRDLVTGAELQITSDDEVEYVSAITPEFVTFAKVNDPYGFDTYAFDFESHGITNLNGMEVGIDDTPAGADSDTILFSSNTGTSDVWAYDVSSQTVFSIATDGSANEIGQTVVGDFALLSISTGGGYTLYTHRLSNKQRAPISETINYIVAADGDYVLYRDPELRALRLSTGVSTLVTSSFDAASLLNGVAVWTEYNGATYDVKTRTLPSGTVTTLSNTGDAGSVAALPSGIAWDSHRNGTYVFDVYYSADGGATQDLASNGKIFLPDVLDEYDVAIVSADIDSVSSFGDDTITAILAGGLPVLSFDRDGSAIASHFADEALYGITTDAADCGPLSVRLSNSTHPAFEGFPAGAYLDLERSGLASVADYAGRALLIDDLAPPPGWTPLASYDESSACVLDEETAIATFTSTEGTAVILDGAATDFIAVWEAARRELLISELRYLASTRAP